MNGNLTLASATIIIATFFLVFSLQLPPSATPITLGPGAWPTTILSLMLIMGIILFIRTLLQRKAQKVKRADDLLAKSEELEKKYEAEEVHKTKYLFVLGIIIAFILLMKYVGFIIATPIMLIAIAYIVGVNRWLPLIISSVVGTAILTYVFTILLSIVLPRGVGVFKTFTEIFY